jgi:two-component system alkaline phosphatase synthesis response regulator PhoP
MLKSVEPNTIPRIGRGVGQMKQVGPESGHTILIVEDDPSVSQLMRLYLVQDGHQVITAADGLQAVDVARTKQPSLILLDLMLPGMSGQDVCTTLRQESNVPIIMVTARVEEADRLSGLDMGADDYVTKPFSPRELVARVRAVLRRTVREQQRDQANGGTLVADEIVVNLNGRTVKVAGKVVNLTPTEYRLLTYFMESAGRTVSREQIIQNSFGYEFEGFDRTVDTHISNLRRKIEAPEGGRKHLQTVYGVGYRFEHAPSD